ncbi:MAG TPA: exosortase/archaeosortase family protein [Actinospica sp.]|nr:exosortase/archaeosortase family protein [Actinospica sp.]
MSTADVAPGGGSYRARRDGVRQFIALVTILGAILAVAEQSWYRGVEARMGAWAVHELLGYAVIAANSGPTFFFGYHEGARIGYLGLEVSLACSSVLLVAPAAVATAVLAVVSRIPMSRLALAFAATAALVTVINVLRFVLIALLVDAWGAESGFGWAHSFFGSLLTLAGLAGATWLYYRLARRTPSARRD